VIFWMPRSKVSIFRLTLFERQGDKPLLVLLGICDISKPPVNHRSSNIFHVCVSSNMIHPLAIQRIPSFHRQIQIRQQILRIVQQQRIWAGQRTGVRRDRNRTHGSGSTSNGGLTSRSKRQTNMKGRTNELRTNERIRGRTKLFNFSRILRSITAWRSKHTLPR
jgi:hypothetical protein